MRPDASRGRAQLDQSGQRGGPRLVVGVGGAESAIGCVGRRCVAVAGAGWVGDALAAQVAGAGAADDELHGVHPLDRCAGPAGVWSRLHAAGWGVSVVSVVPQVAAGGSPWWIHTRYGCRRPWRRGGTRSRWGCTRWGRSGACRTMVWTGRWRVTGWCSGRWRCGSRVGPAECGRAGRNWPDDASFSTRGRIG